MPQSYEARETNGSLTNQFFTNYTVQAPQGLFSADGFDVTPDVANIKIL